MKMLSIFAVTDLPLWPNTLTQEHTGPCRQIHCGSDDHLKWWSSVIESYPQSILLKCVAQLLSPTFGALLHYKMSKSYFLIFS